MFGITAPPLPRPREATNNDSAQDEDG
jgi:hypothetical protein